MDMGAKLPTMSDAELSNLLANAQRLEQAGNERQQTQVARLMPLLTAEIGARKTAKLADMKARRKVARKPKAEVAVKKPKAGAAAGSPGKQEAAA